MRTWSILILLLLSFLYGCNTREKHRALTPAERRTIMYSKSYGHVIQPKIFVPDSLGGSRLLGSITMDVAVTQDGSLHGYEVRRIEISPDTLHWFVYSRNTWKASGDSLVKEFRPWLDSFYRGLRVVGAEKDSMFLLMDTLSYNFVINFGHVGNLDTLTAKKRGLYPSIYREGR